VKESAEKTIEEWKVYYEKQFCFPDLASIPSAPEIDELLNNNPELLEVFPHDIEKAFEHSNMNSSPGPDKLT